MTQKILPILLTFVILSFNLFAQTSIVKGQLLDHTDKSPITNGTILIPSTGTQSYTNDSGYFQVTFSEIQLSLVVVISSPGYLSDTVLITREKEKIYYIKKQKEIDEVTITSQMKQSKRSAEAIPTEIYNASFFRKNPTPSIFEALSMVNGVRPQLNCNVCNTGDIHINGMEGPYTLILIDGMPIVSALSSVYGLNGIPNSLVEKIEVVKGPTAAIYGSEAMGGMINIITKSVEKAPRLNVDLMATSWREINTDLTFKAKLNKNIQTLVGINYFNYQLPYDKNKDGFTDVTLQNRISIFNKWNFARKHNKLASLAARYVYEDRWGGQMNWNKEWRGSDSIYGESIYTNRWEILGLYQLPVEANINTQFSIIGHHQDSYYGSTSFQADQKVAFAQMYWDTKWHQHSIKIGSSIRYTFYNDNTPATANEHGTDKPNYTPLTGIFISDDWHINSKHLLYMGYRLDYDPLLHEIHSPRLAYKWTTSSNNNLRVSFGKGFRAVNIFTEDHAALTGARKVEITETLRPEQSYNSNINYNQTLLIGNGFINLDVLAFYSYFTNKITGDYNTDPDKIIYKNLEGHAISRGITINADATFSIPLNIRAGINYLDVYQINTDASTNTSSKSMQLFAPKWSGNFSISYAFPYHFDIDLTGQINGPMKLPLQHNDYRPEYSPTFCTANIQCSKKIKQKMEVYAGIKNILNFIPKDTYMRPFDPFDKNVGDPVQNPNGYTFDTEYNYAALQGIRYFLGVRYTLN